MASQQYNNKRRILWIDVAKFIAIGGVLVDHTKNIVYSNPDFQHLSFYSVALFIFIMGVTQYQSLDRHYHKQESVRHFIWKRVLQIYIPYVVASLIYFIVAYKTFNLESFIQKLIYFKMSGPFYYVCLYIQLLLILPFLYIVIHKNKGKKSYLFELLILVIIMLFSAWANVDTNILNLWGGGGKLFGGSFLVVMYLGMLTGKYYDKITISKKLTIPVTLFLLIIVSILCYVVILDNHIIDSFLPILGTSRNPPGLTFILFSVSIAFLVFSSEQTVHYYGHRCSQMVFSAAALIGKHTLYIFLYHRLFIDYILPLVDVHITLSSSIFVRIGLYCVLIVGPIFIEIIIKKVKQYLIISLDSKRDSNRA